MKFSRLAEQQKREKLNLQREEMKTLKFSIFDLFITRDVQVLCLLPYFLLKDGEKRRKKKELNKCKVLTHYNNVL